MTALFETVELAPRDPIFGLNEQFNADTNPNKVNLGVGVYQTDEGKIPLMGAVHKAELALAQEGAARNYLPIDGLARYNQATQKLLFGADSQAVKKGLVATIQTLGGTGALKIGADFLSGLLPIKTVYISDPSWENHRAIFQRAGYTVNTYPYYNEQTKALNLDAMVDTLAKLPAKSLVVLHACCHNPTGLDPTPEQWEVIAKTIRDADLVPFIDIAYQGFGEGLDTDAAVVRLFAQTGITTFISSSYSKSFSLYGERVGALSILCQSTDEAERVLSQVKRVVRTNYSNPPTHGALVVATTLDNPTLFNEWSTELSAMRERIKSMRQQLVEKLHALQNKQRFDHVLTQRGMFSYSGLQAQQVEQLRDQHAVYAVLSGRICLAALNHSNIDYVAKAIAEVLQN